MRKIYVSIFLSLQLIACKKWVEIKQPDNQVTVGQVFDDSTSALSALLNVYAAVDKTIDPFYNKSLGLYSDELYYTGTSSTDYVELSASRLSSQNTISGSFWKNSYFIIYQCNAILEQLENNTKISPVFGQLLQNEARFLRAYQYYQLVNVYGSVPLIVTTEVNTNAVASRAAPDQIMEQVTTDLQTASNNLPETYRGKGKTRVNKWAAAALLARVYLNNKNWAMAYSAADQVISSGLYPLESLANVFLSTSSEAVLQCWSQLGYITDGPILIPGTGTPQFAYRPEWWNTIETLDKRKDNWTKTVTIGTATYQYPFKYKNRSDNTATPEFLMLLRSGEMYLIRAEALARQGNLLPAMADLNIIRSRAGIAAVTGLNQTQLLDSILQERRIELATENGNRFLDLKRYGRLNEILGAIKNTWRKDTAMVFPLPQSELIYNAQLTQNPGY